MDIQASLDRILASKTSFAETFYRRLATDHPQVFRHFQDTNMKHQAHLLVTSLLLIVKDYQIPSESVGYYLRVLGTRHMRKNIERDAYVLWADTMLVSLAEFHADQWNVDLGRQWLDAIKRATEQMFLGYDEPHHV